MTIAEILSKELDSPFSEIIWEDEINEAKEVTGLDYKRHWEEWPLDEKHYSKKTGNRLYGRWVYNHREQAGCKYGDGKIVHHKDNNKHDNKKSNLEVTDRAGHCRIDPNAAKPHEGEKCKDCGGEYWGRGYCKNCYMKHFRAGDFGKYDKSKNYSKKKR